MPEFYVAPQQRGRQSAAVWENYQPAFAVGTLTLPVFMATLNGLDAALLSAQNGQAGLEAAITARDANSRFLKDIATRGPAILESNLDPDSEADDEFNGLLDEIFSIEMVNEAAITARVLKWSVAWTKYNVFRAALTPALPPMLVGAVTMAQLKSEAGTREAKLRAVEDRRADLNAAKSDLRAIVRRLDRFNKRWYQAWKNAFAPDSAAREALSQITTEDGTSAPDALEIAALTPQNDGKILVSYLPDGGAGASEIALLFQLVGVDPDFGNSVPAELAGQRSGPFAAGTTVKFQTRASNSAGTTQSDIKTVTL